MTDEEDKNAETHEEGKEEEKKEVSEGEDEGN